VKNFQWHKLQTEFIEVGQRFQKLTRKEATKKSLLVVIRNWAQNIIRYSVNSSEFIVIKLLFI